VLNSLNLLRILQVSFWRRKMYRL